MKLTIGVKGTVSSLGEKLLKARAAKFHFVCCDPWSEPLCLAPYFLLSFFTVRFFSEVFSWRHKFLSLCEPNKTLQSVRWLVGYCANFGRCQFLLRAFPLVPSSILLSHSPWPQRCREPWKATWPRFMYSGRPQPNATGSPKSIPWEAAVTQDDFWQHHWIILQRKSHWSWRLFYFPPETFSCLLISLSSFPPSINDGVLWIIGADYLSCPFSLTLFSSCPWGSNL